jgi:hypothetical protein
MLLCARQAQIRPQSGDEIFAPTNAEFAPPSRRSLLRFLAAQALFAFNRGMKSAYELAMERLQKNAPVVPLTDDQRAEIAEIDSTYKAKIAEKELLLKDQIKKEVQAGKFKEVESLQKQLAMELRRLQEEAEARKEKVRNRGSQTDVIGEK